VVRDPWQDPDVKAWMARTAETLPAKIKASNVVISLAPSNGKPDVKFSVELGMSIMLDKPILAVVQPGTRVPDHLVRVADLIVECDMNNPADQERLAEAIKKFVEKHIKGS
jgi:hypothetical protein